MKRNNDRRRLKPRSRLRASRRALASTNGIRGGVLKKGGKGGDGNGRRHTLLDATHVREDKARKDWHHGPRMGRERGKCVAKGHLQREGAGPDSRHGRKKERAVRHSEPQREARSNVAPAAEKRRLGGLSCKRKAKTPR